MTILDLEGNIIMGGGSAQLRDSIHRLIAEGKKMILLNFAGVKYIDSGGTGELVSSSVALSRVGGQLKLLNLSGKVEEVMALTNLLSMFEIYDTEARAIKEFSSTT